MRKLLSKFILYRVENNTILDNISVIINDYNHSEGTEKEEYISRIYEEIHRLLELATLYGFKENLWQNYLTFLLITHENPFSMTCEKLGGLEGKSVNLFAKNDFKVWRELFDYDFSEIEQKLNINCFSVLTNYNAVDKNERAYYKNVSQKVQSLWNEIKKTNNEDGMFEVVTNFYKQYGVGMFGLNKAFRIKKIENELQFIPITNTEQVSFQDIVGYELQKQKLIENTKAFVEGKKANNCLLFGDAGTGKSTSIKALMNEFYDQGLRIIEIYKHQFQDLSSVISQIKNRNYRFIIYMDDLSFEEFEIEYKFLKAVIEGGLESKPDNILIYATSNRRHLIRETWSDRSDVVQEEMHHSDTMQEKLSLVYRFGVTIHFGKPTQKEYYKIVTELAKKYPEIILTEQELCAEANKWELSHGGISGRTAQQFIHYLLGK